MWCLRYFVILPLLPFPTCSPVFQFAFLVSMIAAHRPCVSCGLMLIALFIASCAIQECYRCWFSLSSGLNDSFFTFNPSSFFNSSSLPSPLPIPSSTTSSLLPSPAASADAVISHATEAVAKVATVSPVSVLSRWRPLFKESYEFSRGGAGVRLSFGLR